MTENNLKADWEAKEVGVISSERWERRHHCIAVSQRSPWITPQYSVNGNSCYVDNRGWTNSCNFGRIYCYFSSQPETNIWFEIGMIWSPHHSKILNICYKTWSYSNNFSIFEIISIFALWFSSISNSNSKILNRKVKPSDQKQRVASRNQEFCSAKILVFLQTLPSFDFRD